MKLSKKSKNIIITILIIVLMLVAIILMLFNGYIIPTKLEAEKYEVRGVDVSEYQGEVDWDKIKEQGISFAFIKATEGSESKDRYFNNNYEKLKNTDMLLGVYHFFSFESSGEEQAGNYINTVGNIENDDTLILPIIDVEYYGNYKSAKPSKDWVIEEMQTMLDKMEETYRVKPMIYTTMEFYDYYINGNFSDYDIWIRDVITKPNLENRDWKFWQYTGKGKLDGYSGKEKFIDLNVFNGSKDGFESFVEIKKQEKKANFEEEERIEKEQEENTVTSIWETTVTNIEGNNFTVQTEQGESLKVVLNDNSIVFNRRTNENMDISNIKVNDKIDFDNVYKKQGEITFAEGGEIFVTRDIHGEELKEELLSSDIQFDITGLTKKGSNYILTGIIRDLYYTNNYQEAESFEIEVIVNNETTILGVKGKPEEELNELYKYEIYITFDKNELKKGNLVAGNIEGMGC